MGDVETGTIWQQGAGEAIYGKLKGSQLEYLPYQQTSIKEWLLLYPGQLAAQSHWWFGWKEFHPNTEIWKA